MVSYALNENNPHRRNEVLVNSDRVKHADQYLITNFDEIIPGLGKIKGF